MVSSVPGLFIILSPSDAEKVRGVNSRGAALQPMPLDDGRFFLGLQILDDNDHEQHIPFLATLPLGKLVKTENGTLSVRWNSERPTDPSIIDRIYVPRNMHNPLDNPPMPAKGDWSEAALYKSIGVALSRWERFETYFADLFTCFLGEVADATPAHRAYGSIMSFEGRSGMVKAAASAYFRLYPRRILERACKELFERAVKLSGHRNRIAHGIVEQYSTPAGETRGLALLPPSYATNRRKLGPDPRLQPLPDYAYTTGEISFFTGHFEAIVEPTSRLQMLLMFHSHVHRER